VLLAAAIVERANTGSIAAMGGMAGRMGRGAALWVIAALAAIGFPGLAGFIGQLLIVIGAYPGHRIATPLAVLGIVLVAGAMIWAVQRILFGPLPERHGRVRDLGTLELANGVGLVALIVLLGILPAILMDSINFSVITLLTRLSGG
jgi:NADH-quinone oxidoreductase subunit M